MLVAFVVVMTLAAGGGALRTVMRIWRGRLPYTGLPRLAAHHGLRPEVFAVWREENELLESLSGYARQRFGAYTAAGGPEQVWGARVSANFFRTLGVNAALGRTFLPQEDEAGFERVAILSAAFWKQRLGGDPRAIGAQLPINGEKHAIIGVLPDDFWFASRQLQIFVPLGPARVPVGAILRLKPGVTRDDARRELREIARNNDLWTRSVISPIGEELLREIEPLYRFSMFALGCVALLAAFYVNRRRLQAGVRYAAALVAESTLALATVMGAWVVVANPDRQVDPGVGLSYVGLLFHLLSAGAVYWSLLDHRYRCRVCLRRLRMPVPTGSWSTPLLDRPGTEYICPYGHGKLNVAHVHLFGMEAAHWTYYGELWEELVHREASAGQ